MGPASPSSVYSHREALGRKQPRRPKESRGDPWLLCRDSPDGGLTLLPGWNTVAQSQLTATSASQAQVILPPQPPKWLGLQGYQSSMDLITGRFPAEESHGSPVRLFWQARLFCRRQARRFPVGSIWDGQAWLVLSPQGKQQLEALRTESFTASTENPGRSSSVGKEHPPKEN
ncbi:hypothetical protein AAY473_040417 [Plecturocebus cupreus]